MRRIFAAAVCIFALSSVRAAHADDDVAKAREIFAEGVKRYQAGDLEGARTLFRQADAEHHAPAIVYNIGLAEEKLGHPQAAVDAYEKYIAEAGDAGDFATAAAAAIAQIKARSTRLRVETKPPGAHVFLDGAPLSADDPTVLVTAAHHVVVAQAETWRDEKEIETKAGEQLTVTLAAPEPAPKPPSICDTDPTACPPPGSITPLPARDGKTVYAVSDVPHPDDLILGAEFAFVPAYMLGVTKAGANNARPAISIFAGPLLEVGYALNERFEFMGRVLGGLGPDGNPTYAWMGGPGLSVDIVPGRIWIGATFIGGDLETKAKTPKVRYGTDIVFGTLAELNVVILNKPSGQWMAGFQPAFLLTEMHQDNTTFFFPFTFGYRSY